MRSANNCDFAREKHRKKYADGEQNKSGIRLTIDKDIKKYYWDAIQYLIKFLIIKVKGKPLNITITVLFTPKPQSREEAIETFYNLLDDAKTQCKSLERTECQCRGGVS